MCSQTVQRCCIVLRETFYNSIIFTVIKKYAKGAVVEISAVFGLLYYATLRRVFRKRTF